MTKLGFSIIASMLFSQLALANDTSFARIDVDAIDTNVATGSFISFEGEEAKKLMQVLPAISTAGGPVLANGNHALVVYSPGYEVKISCSTISRSLVEITPKCTIKFNEKIEGPETFKFNPETQCRAN